MGVMKRMNAKFGSHGIPTGDYKLVAELFASWADGYVPPVIQEKKTRKPRKSQDEVITK